MSTAGPGAYLESLFGLDGRLAVVTGASRGIGLAIAEALARAGADVIGVSRDPARSEAGRVVQAAGRTFEPLACDLSDRDDVERLCSLLSSRRVDVLVNNGGTIRRAPAAEHGDTDWDHVMDVNLRAAFVLSREVGAGMLARREGKIVNIASMLSFQGGVNVPGYTASKSGLLGLTRALANEWAGTGVNVNAIAPGYVATANNEALRQDPRRSAEILGRIPVGRWGAPADLVGAAVFLASAASAYVHGAVVAVDGGWLAR